MNPRPQAPGGGSPSYTERTWTLWRVWVTEKLVGQWNVAEAEQDEFHGAVETVEVVEASALVAEREAHKQPMAELEELRTVKVPALQEAVEELRAVYRQEREARQKDRRLDLTDDEIEALYWTSVVKADPDVSVKHWESARAKLEAAHPGLASLSAVPAREPVRPDSLASEMLRQFIETGYGHFLDNADADTLREMVRLAVATPQPDEEKEEE